MTLTVRRLRIDLDTPVPRLWCGGDAFRTAFLDALSMGFPAGEQMFIDSMKKALAALPAHERERFAAEVQGFIGQEATHRRIHERFNAHLERQGLVNVTQPRIERRRAFLESIDTRNWLASTAAIEHVTAVFSQHLLAHAALLDGAEPRLRALWQWHCSEELEHRSTAFELYLALGGNLEWRRRVFKAVARIFAVDTAWQTWLNLWHGGTWWRAATWASAWRTLFGRDHGLVRHSWGAWKAYLRDDFHPSRGSPAAAERWLLANAELAPPVKA